VRKLTLRELMQYPVVLPTNRFPTEAELTEVYVQAGLSPQPSHYRCNSVDLVRKIVLGTDAIAPLLTFRRPGDGMKRTFHVIEDVMPLREHVLGLALLRRNEPSPPVNAFREIFRGFGARTR
jgi:DNA-binding transcriptional LysR family regulator